MKIDILRSTNPALSLSSQTEDQFDLRQFYGNPVPTELITPFSTAAVRNLDVAAEKFLSRSKSAPPLHVDAANHAEERARAIHLLQTRLSSSYNEDGSNHNCSYYPSNIHSDGSTSNYYLNNSDGSSSPSELDPENNLCDPILKNSFVLGPHCSAYLQLHYAPTQNGTEDQLDQGTNPEEPLKPSAEPIINDKRSSSPLLVGEGTTPFSQNSGGVLVLRPNPVKTFPPLVQSVVVGGVVAPSPRLATGSFVSTSHSSPLIYHQQTRQEEEELIEEIPVVDSKAVVLALGGKPQTATALRKKSLKEKQEKARLAQLRRRQELQCNFPNNFAMPLASGRSSPDHGRREDRDNGSPSRSQGNGATRHEQHQQQYSRGGSTKSSSSSIPPPLRNERRMMSSSDDDLGGEGPRSIQSTPVFARLVTDEVREIHAYTRMVENQSIELEKLRTYQKDLEKRLQDEARQYEELEATLEVRERDWMVRFETLESEIRRLNSVVNAEENKNKLLLDQIRKKDQDIQGMLKKKYDNEVPSTRPARRTTDPRPDRLIHAKPQSEGKVSGSDLHRSPADYLKSLGSAEKVRERNTKHLLMDFFGL